jgi:hypothetical protein
MTQKQTYNRRAQLNRYRALDAMGLSRSTRGKIKDLQAARANGAAPGKQAGMFKQLGLSVNDAQDGRYEVKCCCCPKVINRASKQVAKNDMVRHVRDRHPEHCTHLVSRDYKSRPQLKKAVKQEESFRCPKCGCDIVEVLERRIMALKAVASINLP